MTSAALLLCAAFFSLMGAVTFAMTVDPRSPKTDDSATAWASIAFMSASLFVAFAAGQNWGS
jgi:hypothetical protein